MTEPIKPENELAKLKQQMFYSKLIVGSIIALVLIAYFSNFHVSVSVDNGDWGTFGDFFGGILNPVIASFALYWLITSVNLQIQELKKTNEALEKTVETAEKQQNQASIQNFENLFFELLKTKSEVTNEISESYYNEDGGFDSIIQGKTAIKTHINSFKNQHNGKEWIDYYNKKLMDMYGSYFRFCYQIIKLINNNLTLNSLEKEPNKDYSIKQKEYFDIFRATLTQHELEAFFFNCLSHHGDKKFKHLIEKYGLFKPLISKTTISEDSINQIFRSAYKYNPCIFENNTQWNEYFNDLNKIDLTIDATETTKNLNYIRQTNIHLGQRKNREYVLLDFEKIKNKISEKIDQYSDKFKNTETISGLNSELQKQHSELHIFKNVNFNYEMYMILKYDIDLVDYIKTKKDEINTINNPT